MFPDPPSRPVPGREWKLTSAAFERFLSALDPDRDRAALAFQSLHRRVVGLLEWWGSVRANDLADQTFDRVARKLEEGTEVPPQSFGAFVRGVARLVFYESTRDVTTPIEDRDFAAPADTNEDERALACLDRCLESFTAEERRLVLSYYGEGKKSEVREKLANELGISNTALRIRVHRLRSRLEACVAACLDRR